MEGKEKKIAKSDIEEMFCYQCEQTRSGVGCTGKFGVCMKSAETSAAMDYMLHGLQATCAVMHAVYTSENKELLKAVTTEHEKWLFCLLFSTVTNVDFVTETICEYVYEAAVLRDELLSKVKAAKGADLKLPEIAEFKFAGSRAEILKEAPKYSVVEEMKKFGKEKGSLRELMMYGIKGVAAYAFHAMVLGETCSDVAKDVAGFLGNVLQKENITVDELWGQVLAVGETNARCMKHLDDSNCRCYGAPSPHNVQWILDASKGSRNPGHCILVSGHDLHVLDKLLEKTAGSGIFVYTHGEMLPGHGYPVLRSKYPHFVGHYGTAWQNQRKEFLAFPGPIIMTTNCYMPAPETYLHRVFSITPVAGEGVKPIHAIRDKDTYEFDEVISLAKELPGLANAVEGENPNGPRDILVGFAHSAVLEAADQVIAAVKTGKLRHIFVIGGCDGWERDRNHYTELASRIPEDCLILTCGCGKYKINCLKYGNLPGTEIPRLLDMGQCNDSYSSLIIAQTLAQALDLDNINKLPLTIVLSWFEQKAVCVLLSLLQADVHNIYLGPKFPAFITPEMGATLKSLFNIRPFTDANIVLDEVFGSGNATEIVASAL